MTVETNEGSHTGQRRILHHVTVDGLEDTAATNYQSNIERLLVTEPNLPPSTHRLLHLGG